MLFSTRVNTYKYRIQIKSLIDNSSYFVNNMNQIINKNTANYVKEKANTFNNQRYLYIINIFIYSKIVYFIFLLKINYKF